MSLSHVVHLAAVCLIAAGSSAQDCSPTGLSVLGKRPGFSKVYSELDLVAVAAFDDGDGPSIFFSGTFDAAGGQANPGFAKWDGERFVDVPTPPFAVSALIAHDDGNGLALFAGGRTGCARWDGTSWTLIGSHAATSWKKSFAVYDDGSGTALYMGGLFGGAGLGIAGRGLARWDGQSWQEVGGAFESLGIEALEVYDDGTGTALFVGSASPMGVDGVSLSSFAAWNGQEWSNLGDVEGIADIEAFDDGLNGPQLAISRSSFLPGPKLYRWDGAGFSVMGAGSYDPPSCLEFVDFGNGPALYTSASGLGTLVRWDGLDWSPDPDSPSSGISAMLEVQEPGGPAVYCVGGFVTVSGFEVNAAARRDALGWSALGAGFGDEVDCSVSFDDGAGPALYFGGEMLGVNGVELRNVGRWDGTNLTGVGAGLDVREVSSLAVFDDGTGAALYAGVQLLLGQEASLLWRWDGVNWVEVGDRIWNHQLQVKDMLVFDDGNGPALWCALTTAFGVSSSSDLVLKWDGQALTSFAVTNDFVSQRAVRDLEIYDSGFGPELVAVGSFSSVDGVAALRAARWNGSVWAPMAAGFSDTNATVQSLVVHDGLLYVGGNMAGRLQVWDGASWTTVPNPGISQSLYSYNDGQGDALYSGGSFGVKCWDGNAWSGLLNQASGAVTSFTEYQDRLFFGGRFESTTQTGDAYLSSWGKPCDGPLPYCAASASSSGCLASIGTSNALEQPVSGAGDYQVVAVGVESQKAGVILVGINDAAVIPFLNGTLCMQPPISSSGSIAFSGGVGSGNCSGSFAMTVNTGDMIPVGLDGGAGQSVWHQWWYRDSAAGLGLLSTSLSNAIRLDYR